MPPFTPMFCFAWVKSSLLPKAEILNVIGLLAHAMGDVNSLRMTFRLLRSASNDRLSPRTASSRIYSTGRCSGFSPDSLIPAPSNLLCGAKSQRSTFKYVMLRHLAERLQLALPSLRRFPETRRADPPWVPQWVLQLAPLPRWGWAPARAWARFRAICPRAHRRS